MKAIVLALMVLLVAPVGAAAQGLITVGNSKTFDFSATLSSGVDKIAIPANSARKDCAIQNPSGNTDHLFVRFGPLAATTGGNNSWDLAPGVSINCLNGNVVFVGDVHAIAAGADPYIATESR